MSVSPIRALSNQVCGKEWIGLMEEKIEEILARVRNAIAQGLTEDETAETVKYRDLCVLDDDYKDVHDKVEMVSVRMVYRFLKENE